MRIVEAVLPYPSIDPYLIHISGNFGIRWYAISYITGLLIGWWVALRTLRETALWKNAPFTGKPPATADEIGDFVVWTMLGVVIGGRLGWVLLYGTFYCGIWGAGQDWCRGLPTEFVTTPRLLELWNGGMSFHGGLAGVATAIYLFCRSRKLDLLKLADLSATVAPIGAPARRAPIRGTRASFMRQRWKVWCSLRFCKSAFADSACMNGLVF